MSALVQMAWFKLNDSLNTLKDQLSSVSNVVQEAFQEPPPDADDENDPWRRFESEKQRSDELSVLCGTQLDEVRGEGCQISFTVVLFPNRICIFYGVQSQNISNLTYLPLNRTLKYL